MNAKFLLVLMLSSPLISMSVSAFELGDLNVRGQSEATWQYTPPRNETIFNPQQAIVDNPEHTGILGLRLRPKYQYKQIALRADSWLQSRITGTETKQNFFLQNASFDWSINDTLVLSGGAAIQHWGPGYIWNPSNPFQDRDVNFEDRVISYKRDGNPFASLDWTGESGLGVTLYFVHFKSREKIYGTGLPDQNSVTLKVNKQFESSDASLTYARLDDMNFISTAASMSIGAQLELHGEFSLRDKRRTVLPQRLQIAPQDSFFQLQEAPDTDWRVQLLVGGQYTTENQINYIFEYLYNGEAYSNSEYNKLEQAAYQSTAQLDSFLAAPAAGLLGNANGLLGTLKQHYLFARIADNHLVGGIQAKAFVRYGIQDTSIIVGGLLSYPIKDGFNISLGGQYFGDVSGSETAAIPFRCVIYSGITLLF